MFYSKISTHTLYLFFYWYCILNILFILLNPKLTLLISVNINQSKLRSLTDIREEEEEIFREKSSYVEANLLSHFSWYIKMYVEIWRIVIKLRGLWKRFNGVFEYNFKTHIFATVRWGHWSTFYIPTTLSRRAQFIVYVIVKDLLKFGRS